MTSIASVFMNYEFVLLVVQLGATTESDFKVIPFVLINYESIFLVMLVPRYRIPSNHLRFQPKVRMTFGTDASI